MLFAMSSGFDWDAAPVSLSEQIARRFVPQSLEEDGELMESMAPRGKTTAAADMGPSGALRIAPEIALTGKRYRSRKSSRADVWAEE